MTKLESIIIITPSIALILVTAVNSKQDRKINDLYKKLQTVQESVLTLQEHTYEELTNGEQIK